MDTVARVSRVTVKLPREKVTGTLIAAPSLKMPLGVVEGTPVIAGAPLTGARAHNSEPWLPSLALKKSVPLTFVRPLGFELALPGLRSWTSTVPAEVPLL